MRAKSWAWVWVWAAAWTLAGSNAAHACSCLRISNFSEVAVEAPLLAEVRVVRASFRNEAQLTAYRDRVVLWRRDTRKPFPSTENSMTHADGNVLRAIKGQVPSATVQVFDPGMCFATVYPSEMFVGAVYVIALFPTQPSSGQREDASQPSIDGYHTAVCAENALLRSGDALYTFVIDEATNFKPKKKFYVKYADFLKTMAAPAAPAAPR